MRTSTVAGYYPALYQRGILQMANNINARSTRIIPFLVCVTIAGCSETAVPPEPLDRAIPDYHAFTCTGVGEVLVRYVGPDTLEIKIAGEATILPRERSASGAKFAKDDLLFWNKGDEAVLQSGAARYSCTKLPAATPEHETDKS